MSEQAMRVGGVGYVVAGNESGGSGRICQSRQ